MKKTNLVLGATVVAALGIAGAASHAEAATIGVVQATSTVNVRSGAGTSFSKIGSLYAGAKATALSSSNGWTKINYNGKVGYVSSQYVRNITTGSSTSPSSSNTSTSNVNSGTYSTTAALNVRSGAGTSYSKIGTLTKGSVVKVVSSSNGWAKINYNRKTGYVSSQYLQKSSFSNAGTSNITSASADKKGLITKANLLVINQNTMTISLYKNGVKTDSFACATGKAGGRTPVGVWSITNKIKNRPYYKWNIPGGDPKNPLGNRWMQLSCGAAYGIHGTCYPWSMGSYASEGCVRMTNSTIEYLYDKVPVGTTVIISSIGGSYSNKDIAASKGIYVNY